MMYAKFESRLPEVLAVFVGQCRLTPALTSFSMVDFRQQHCKDQISQTGITYVSAKPAAFEVQIPPSIYR